jgi:2-dehydropantoate 2-reductase
VRTLILGGGAIGSTLAGYLRRGDRDVTVVDAWFPHVEAVRQSGLHVEAVEGEFTADPVYLHPDEVGGVGLVDLVIVAGKSYDTRALALEAREHLHPGTLVMSAQNGMNDEPIGAIVGRERMVACVVAMGADLHASAQVRRSSARAASSVVIGHLAAGRDPRVLEDLRDLFDPLGGVEVAENAWPERWGKLTLNTMSNALAGLTGLWSDTLWTDPVAGDILIALGHETASVAAAAGADASPVLKRIPQQLLLEADSTAAPAWAAARATMRAIGEERIGRKANRASLLQDVMKGRRTEVDHLNGWVVTRGRELGVATPTHERLIAELRSVERGRRAPTIANAAPVSEVVTRVYGG